MRVLVGDVGATHSRLAVVEVTDGRLELLAVERFPSGAVDGVGELVARFAGRGCEAVCLGVPGPVREGVARLTNLPWVVDAGAVARAAGLDRALLLNDLEALAWGVHTLAGGDLEVLQPGRPGSGPAAVIAAGSGLGEALLVWDGAAYRPVAGEGGHADFAPGSDTEIALLRWLRRRYGHVSWERVLSGPGLVDLYRFLVEHRMGRDRLGLGGSLERGDPAEAIVDAARGGRDALCGEAVALFVRLYGAEAGNLALRVGATGGVFLGGGIAPKLLPELRQGGFLEAFCDKGRMAPLLSGVPVKVVLTEDASLRGAGRAAATLLGVG